MNLMTQINNALLRSCYSSKRMFALQNGFNVSTFNKTLHRIVARRKTPKNGTGRLIVAALKEKAGLDLDRVIGK